MNYKISFLEKRLLVTIDEKLIIREVKKALRIARRIDQEPTILQEKGKLPLMQRQFLILSLFASGHLRKQNED